LNQSVSLDGPAPEGAGIPPGTTVTSLDGALLRVAAALPPHEPCGSPESCEQPHWVCALTDARPVTVNVSLRSTP